MKWAILSGIEGNLTVYEAVLQDIRRQAVSDLYILGDVIGLQGENEAVIQRLQSPQTRRVTTPGMCGLVGRAVL